MVLYGVYIRFRPTLGVSELWRFILFGEFQSGKKRKGPRNISWGIPIRKKNEKYHAIFGNFPASTHALIHSRHVTRQATRHATRQHTLQARTPYPLKTHALIHNRHVTRQATRHATRHATRQHTLQARTPYPLTLYRHACAHVCRILLYVRFHRFAVEKLYGTQYQSGSFSLIDVGSAFHCLRSFSFFSFLFVHKHNCIAYKRVHLYYSDLFSSGFGQKLRYANLHAYQQNCCSKAFKILSNFNPKFQIQNLSKFAVQNAGKPSIVVKPFFVISIVQYIFKTIQAYFGRV